MMTDRLETLFSLIDAANSQDPHHDQVAEHLIPRALLYGRRMSLWLERLDPLAPEVLKIAARGQHLRRFDIPRDHYPEGRTGYLNWRTTLYRFHADRLTELMQAVGYDEPSMLRVRTLVEKRGIKTDPEVQRLEDVICLVFLEYYFIDFAARHDEEKLIGIVQKTWSKMSDAGHHFALTLPFPESIQALLGKALGS